MFEQEIRPTPAALIDKEFVAKIQAFFQKETEFNERFWNKYKGWRIEQLDSRAPAEWQKIAEGVFGRSP